MSTDAKKGVVLSVRLGTPDERAALTARCREEGISVAHFIKECVRAYLEGRLKIDPGQHKSPSFYLN